MYSVSVKHRLGLCCSYVLKVGANALLVSLFRCATVLSLLKAYNHAGFLSEN